MIISFDCDCLFACFALLFCFLCAWLHGSVLWVFGVWDVMRSLFTASVVVSIEHEAPSTGT